LLEIFDNPQKSTPKLALIIPCYNEQEVVELTVLRLLEIMRELENLKIISKKSFIFLVDDGSTDGTFEIAKRLHSKDKKVKALKFSRNFGNQNAILAGLGRVYELGVDCAITIDADLQQDESVIKDFVIEYQKGNDIVFGVRKNYHKQGLFKKFSSALFYKIMHILGAKITPNHSEYRLTSKRAMEALSQYGEYSLFLRGVFSEIGLQKSYVEYNIKPRAAGQTKFSWARLVALALNGITSFSIVPLRFVVVLGFLMALVSFAYGLYVIYEKFFLGIDVSGWATIVVAICFFSGVQIFCLGIIGEYMGQVYNEVKSRPRYIKETELV